MVINYTETPDWDEKARELTDGRGVDCVVEIGGPGTIAMSLKALAVGGHVSLKTRETQHESRVLGISIGRRRVRRRMRKLGLLAVRPKRNPSKASGSLISR